MTKKWKSLSFGALILAASALLSRVLGLVRDMVIAYVFGAGESEGIYALDSYFAAFRVPDLIYTFLVAGAMSAAFVPLYSQLKKKSTKKASEFGSQVIHLLMILLVIGVGVMWICAPLFVPWITPGFSESLQEQTAQLTRIMLLSPFFLGLSSVFQGIENSHKTFYGIAMAPLVYNLSLIIGAFFFGEAYGVYALTWSVVIGALMHFLVQVPGVLSTSFKYEWNWNFKSKEIKDFLILTFPRLAGIGFMQLNTVLDTLLASLLTVGSVSVYNYALNLQSLPHGVVAVSVSIAVFASLSEFDDDKEKFLGTIKRSLNTILFWVLPAIVGLFLLRDQIVEVLLMRGAFDATASARTSLMLGIFVWAALGQSIVPLFARAFYALKDTKTPVISVLISGTLQVLISLLLIFHFNLPVWALAISSIVGWSLNALLLVVIMARRLGHNPFDFFDRITAWSVMHVVVMASSILLLQSQSYPHEILELVLTITIPGLLYLGLHRITRTNPRSL